ncbi:Uu.00g060520.m01.CDS01 [Anthostomella pinea]|uniref:Uu.00g060520.m01.CDS01 n=1 Tax=Anthostomella pinea TaxID=933095 RepID=A0AAI8VTG0_9PEZI|nr:Uu.00g060520.m01.CDS01 [Anthostomella pinea]
MDPEQESALDNFLQGFNRSTYEFQMRESESERRWQPEVGPVQQPRPVQQPQQQSSELSNSNTLTQSSKRTVQSVDEQDLIEVDPRPANGSFDDWYIIDPREAQNQEGEDEYDSWVDVALDWSVATHGLLGL